MTMTRGGGLTVGVIGIGFLGSRISNALLDAEVRVIVYNRTPGRTSDLERRGAVAVSSPRDIAARADLVILALPGPEQVAAVMTDPESGVLSSECVPKVVLDSSTTSLVNSREMAARCSALGIGFLDAPVTGMPPGMHIFVGGDASAFETAAPVLEIIGASATLMGPSGSGTVTKLINQLIMYGTFLTVAEGMLLAAQAGLDPELVARTIQQGGAGGTVLDLVPDRLLNADLSDDRGAPLSLIAKDTRLIGELAAQLGVRGRSLAALQGAFESALQDGFGDHYYPAVAVSLAADSSVTLPLKHPLGMPDRRRDSGVNENLALVQRFVDHWNAGTLDRLLEVTSPEFVWRGIDGTIKTFDEYIAGGSSAVPPAITIERSVVQDDIVVVRLRIERNGVVARVTNDIFRIEGGLIVEEWSGHA